MQEILVSILRSRAPPLRLNNFFCLVIELCEKVNANAPNASCDLRGILKTPLDSVSGASVPVIGDM